MQKIMTLAIVAFMFCFVAAEATVYLPRIRNTAIGQKVIVLLYGVVIGIIVGWPCGFEIGKVTP